MTVQSRHVRHSVRSALSAALYTTINAAISASMAQKFARDERRFVSRNFLYARGRVVVRTSLASVPRSE